MINYLETYKMNINFSYIKSVCLVAAFVAGFNRDIMDQRFFLKSVLGKMRRTTKADPKSQVAGQNLMGKTKKFPIERFFGIADFLLSILASDSTEQKNISRSLDFQAAVNSLVEEGFLRRTANKKSDGVAVSSEDLTQIFLKCNYDRNFIEEVAKKIDFKIEEYLDNKDQQA
jgi:hypothetical protein